MKALVLGGGGFLGSHLVDELLKKNHDVRVLDRAAEQYRTTPDAVDYRLGDFADPAVVAEALQDIDTVYHLASATVPSTSNLDPAADITANLVPGVRLFEQLVRLGVRRIVFLSSGGTVYGDPKLMPVAVEHPVSPLCSYGVVKVATEHYLHMFQELYGLSPTILRASNPYGPRQGHLGVQGAIATFLNRLLAAAPDLLDTSLCSISVREKGQSWQRRTHSPRVTSSPWAHSLRGSAGALPANVR